MTKKLPPCKWDQELSKEVNKTETYSVTTAFFKVKIQSLLKINPLNNFFSNDYMWTYPFLQSSFIIQSILRAYDIEELSNNKKRLENNCQPITDSGVNYIFFIHKGLETKLSLQISIHDVLSCRTVSNSHVWILL